MMPISKRNYKKNFLKKPYNRISTPLSGLNLKVQQTWNMQKLATQRVFIGKKTKNKNFEFVYAFSWSNNHSVDLKVHLTVLKLLEKSFSKLPRSLTLRLRGIYGMACRLILRNNIFIHFSSQSSMKACYRAFVCLFKLNDIEQPNDVFLRLHLKIKTRKVLFLVFNFSKTVVTKI